MRVIVCTPIARLNSDNNTRSGYMDEHGHITTEGNYTQAIQDLVDTMYRTDPSLTERLYCVDLTERSIALNIAWGNNAQWLHAFTGAQYNHISHLLNL